MVPQPQQRRLVERVHAVGGARGGRRAPRAPTAPAGPVSAWTRSGEAALLRLRHHGVEGSGLWLAGSDGFAWLHDGRSTW